MNKRLKDNKFAFILTSLIALAIAGFGLSANSIYFEYGGYAVGMVCTILLFAAFCLIYSQVNKEVKKRTIDMLFMSLFVVAICAIFTLLVDISQVLTRGMAITTLVFTGFFWAIILWETTRLVLDIFDIRIKIYEELLEGKNPFAKKKEEIAVNEEIDHEETIELSDIIDTDPIIIEFEDSDTEEDKKKLKNS